MNWVDMKKKKVSLNSNSRRQKEFFAAQRLKKTKLSLETNTKTCLGNDFARLQHVLKKNGLEKHEESKDKMKSMSPEFPSNTFSISNEYNMKERTLLKSLNKTHSTWQTPFHNKSAFYNSFDSNLSQRDVKNMLSQMKKNSSQSLEQKEYDWSGKNSSIYNGLNKDTLMKDYTFLNHQHHEGFLYTKNQLNRIERLENSREHFFSNDVDCKKKKHQCPKQPLNEKHLDEESNFQWKYSPNWLCTSQVAQTQKNLSHYLDEIEELDQVGGNNFRNYSEEATQTFKEDGNYQVIMSITRCQKTWKKL